MVGEGVRRWTGRCPFTPMGECSSVRCRGPACTVAIPRRQRKNHAPTYCPSAAYLTVVSSGRNDGGGVNMGWLSSLGSSCAALAGRAGCLFPQIDVPTRAWAWTGRGELEPESSTLISERRPSVQSSLARMTHTVRPSTTTPALRPHCSP